MSLAFIYWFCLLLMLIFGGWSAFRPNGDRWAFGVPLVLFLALVAIGWKVFGSPIAGG